MLTSRFPFLSSNEAASPNGVWGWAKRLIEGLQSWRPFELMDVPISDKPYYIMRINSDGTAWELVPEELALAGQDLTGLANEVIRVKPTEDGYFIDKEVLHTLVGVALTGKAGSIMRVKPDETGFMYDKEVMETLRGLSLAGKANYFVKVNGSATGFTLSAT